MATAGEGKLCGSSRRFGHCKVEISLLHLPSGLGLCRPGECVILIKRLIDGSLLPASLDISRIVLDALTQQCDQVSDSVMRQSLAEKFALIRPF